MNKKLTWDERYTLAKSYYEHHGNLRVASSFKTKDGYTYDVAGFDLGTWITSQRKQYRLNQLTPECYEKLKLIGMVFESVSDFDWENFYLLAQIYLKHYKNLSIPRNFRTKNGYQKDETGKNLGAWFSIQKLNYQHKKLSVERMEKIKKLFEELEANKKVENQNAELEWSRMYDLAKAYYEYYNHLNIPVNFTTTNGYEKDENGSNLGDWSRKQRNFYQRGCLTKEKIQKLEQIGMIFSDIIKNEWERMYNLAKAYYDYHGNLKISRNFRTKNGYEPDEKGSYLGKWVNKQYCRNIHGLMPKEEYEKLRAIGMIFENQKEEKWNKMYALAKAYYEHFGNLNILTDFKTKNGYEKDEEGVDLGIWINAQRKYYLNGVLSQIHGKQLKAIGMVFEDMYDIEWERMYTLAAVYYKQNSNLMVPVNFKTENGYQYSPNGKKLGGWISRQRTKYKTGQLSQEHLIKLQAIGMIFELRKDKLQNQSVCLSHSIDYLKHKHQIDAIPHREFVAKINYLNSQGISFVINEMLHPIFFMSSVNMQVRYGISLESLITEYQNQLDKIKRI